MVTVTSYGAAGTVTGSCHLIEMDDIRILVDCGMFQGEDYITALNREPLGFDPTTLDAVVLTHGHLDHCGRLPLLVQEGYSGPIYATRPTYDVARFILLDSARIQHEDWLRAEEHEVRHGRHVPPPLYTEQDVFDTLDLFETARYDEPIQVGPLRVTFKNAGHILGSAFIVIEGRAARVVCSGDVGTWEQHVVPDPELPPEADVVLLESTYGGQIHEPLEQAMEKIATFITEVVEAGGNVLIPTFALERAQDVLFILRKLDREGRIPRVKTFLDSPLAINFTRLHRRYPEQLGEAVKRVILRGEDPFSWPGLTLTRTQRESRRIDYIESGAVIMAGSGMATGGRILRHLFNNLWREESGVLFVGFQAEGTLGRALLDGADEVEIYGEPVVVKARIENIEGLSAHADEPQLLKWVAPTRASRVFLIHGESPAPEALQASLKEKLGMESTISERGVTYQAL